MTAAWILEFTGEERIARPGEHYYDSLSGRPVRAINGTVGAVRIMRLVPATVEEDGTYRKAAR